MPNTVVVVQSRLWPHGLQRARLLCSSSQSLLKFMSTESLSFMLSWNLQIHVHQWWYCLTISSSVALFSICFYIYYMNLPICLHSSQPYFVLWICFNWGYFRNVRASLGAWKRICLQYRRPGLSPWVRKIPWRREWLPTLVFLPGEFHGQRSLAGYSPWGCKESDMTEWLSLS